MRAIICLLRPGASSRGERVHRREEMLRRFVHSLGAAAVMAGLVLFLNQGASGQAPASKPASDGASVPKTAWGHPDLQGIWLDEFDTPLERPAKYANKEFFTEEDRAAQDKERSGNEG